ncbi:hypothetical protein AJ79_01710 [Helicocarpus griseus UAMH5409]|uniref:Uncharacterized protein n=1 Tax=Helicocarpus griseus UAMH5409 TaxID=1447875 RepID=A0A2B7Y6E6_9EURO|nr:hypothetical protein AJ79_01710 [Helicocarpus griseus UAMH5409]
MLRMKVVTLLGGDYLRNPSIPGLLAQILPASFESLQIEEVSIDHFWPLSNELENLLAPSNFSTYTPRLVALRVSGRFCEDDPSARTGVMFPPDMPKLKIPADVLTRADGLREMGEGIGLTFELVDTILLMFRGSMIGIEKKNPSTYTFTAFAVILFVLLLF